MSALRDSNAPKRGRVTIPLDSPAVNEDGALRAPLTMKKKTGKDPTKASGVTKKAGKDPTKASAVTVSEDGKSVSMSKGHWRMKLQSATLLRRDMAERDAMIVTQKEDLKQTQTALTLVTEHKNRLVTQNKDLRITWKMWNSKTKLRLIVTKTGESQPKTSDLLTLPKR